MEADSLSGSWPAAGDPGFCGELDAIPGWPVLILLVLIALGAGAGLYLATRSGSRSWRRRSLVVLAASLVAANGLVSVAAGEQVLVTLFGRCLGTISHAGLWYVNPFAKVETIRYAERTAEPFTPAVRGTQDIAATTTTAAATSASATGTTADDPRAVSEGPTTPAAARPRSTETEITSRPAATMLQTGAAASPAAPIISEAAPSPAPTPRADALVGRAPASAPLVIGASTDDNSSSGPGPAADHASAEPENLFDDPAALRITPLRTAEDREAERRAALFAGPGVEVFSPIDGAVLSSDRTFVGIQGEPGMAVTLFDGDSVLVESETRVDGILDVVGLHLTPGPHRLRVRMKNSWGQERWDSLAVHVSGSPTAIELPVGEVEMEADPRTTTELTLRLLDEWGVPVGRETFVNATIEGAEIVTPDADASSVGLQLRTNRRGELAVTLRPGREPGTGTLRFAAGDAAAAIDLQFLPVPRPFILTGTGSVGAGATPDAFGAVTASGSLGEETSFVASVDSRKLDAGRDAFMRSADPLEEAQYPILGDASQAQTLSSSQSAISARVQRGSSFAAYGDLNTSEVLDGLELNRYQRAVSGGSGRVTTGALTLSGFTAMTEQSLVQRRVRGSGISGPYDLGSGIALGTETVVIETRDRMNPQRIVARQTLTRFIEYEIDYLTGILLFKRPVPGADVNLNPVFIEVTFESTGGGESYLVGGVRGSVDLSNSLGLEEGGAVQLGLVGIHSDEAAGATRLLGGDATVELMEGFTVRGEFSRSQAPDSSGNAGSVNAMFALLDGGLTVSGGFQAIGSGFANPSNTALRAGSVERRGEVAARVLGGQLTANHQALSIDAEAVERQQEQVKLLVPLFDKVEVEGGFVNERFRNGATESSSQAGEARLSYRIARRLKLWSEGRGVLKSSGRDTRPGNVGVGADLRITDNATIEVAHRRVFPDDTTGYSVTSVGVRSEVGWGTEAWGNYQLAGGVSGPYNAALVGLQNRLQLTDSWRINTLFERRAGVGASTGADPVRALPFLREEEDYTAFSVAAEFVPAEAPYRLSSKAEVRDGESYSTKLFTFAGDATLGRSLALFARQQYVERDMAIGTSENLRADFGLAFRPVSHNTLNLLGKLTWVRSDNPLSLGVLTAAGREERLAVIGEAIWTPTRATEFAVRYALRETEADRVMSDGTLDQVGSTAHYAGSRLRVRVSDLFVLYGETRVLSESLSGEIRWDAAPSLGVRLIGGVELQAGYRFGDLRDPDFTVSGGHGAFIQLRAGVTEGDVGGIRDFWRSRF